MSKLVGIDLDVKNDFNVSAVTISNNNCTVHKTIHIDGIPETGGIKIGSDFIDLNTIKDNDVLVRLVGDTFIGGKIQYSSARSKLIVNNRITKNKRTVGYGVMLLMANSKTNDETTVISRRVSVKAFNTLSKVLNGARYRKKDFTLELYTNWRQVPSVDINNTK